MIRHLRTALVALLLAAVPAEATWSIVAVDRATGEVAVAVATCLPQSNLTRGLPVIVNGVGAGIIQASGNPALLPPLGQGLAAGLTPEEVLALITADNGGVGLQIGIVSMDGPPVTFTGPGVGAAKLGVAGVQGSLAYAIQGNVLAGRAVVRQAERALLDAPGDLGQRVLAAMVVARQYGGDGRCSCTMEGFGQDPDDCGSPPPDFRKSAHSAAMLVARVGDPEATCLRPNGTDCANAGYYLRLVIRGANAQIPDPDPVDQLVDRYAEWRAARRGRPDAILSRIAPIDPLPADGRSRRPVRVELADVDGSAVRGEGLQWEVLPADPGRATARAENLRVLGDGSLAFDVVAGELPGTERFWVRVSDDLVTAQLWPPLEVSVVPVARRPAR